VTAYRSLGNLRAGGRTQARRLEPKYVESPYHHGSHRELLHLDTRVGLDGADVDAIIVPTIGAPEAMVDAARLARALECWLVVLCSGQAAAAEVVTALGSDAGSRLLAVDVPDIDEHPLLAFTTSSIHRTQTGRRVDTGAKRNLGLLLARIVGWRRILFLDDDIVVQDHRDARRAAALLDRYDSVGLSLGGFPDNSVVCHAHRIGDGRQDCFVGGGALAVNVPKTFSFFPEIYNEDWFFLVDFFVLDGASRPVAVTGQAVQRAYDPFAFPARAEFEEFGDVLAEGLFWLLDQGRCIKDANEPFWNWYLEQRGLFIKDIARRIRSQDLDPAEREAILLALKAAQARRELIPASLCTEYLSAWGADRTRWRDKVLPALPREPNPATAVRILGFRPLAANPRMKVILGTTQASSASPWPQAPGIRLPELRCGTPRPLPALVADGAPAPRATPLPSEI
jgi:hypothetical protein